MKDVLMMILPNCPHCLKAKALMEELRREDARYADIAVRMVDESREVSFAQSLDYYYVPTYFVDGQKIHEGVITKEDVRRVFEAALA